jgi:hypothetical protein
MVGTLDFPNRTSRGEPMRFPIRSAAVIVVAVAAPLFAQDLTIVSKTTSDKSPPETTTSYLSQDHVRMASGQGMETITDPKAGQIMTLDNKKKTYYVTTKQDMEQAAAKMKQRMDSPEMKKAQERLKNLTPEQRKQMEGAMGGLLGSFDVKKTGPTRKIAGYGCETWEITMGELSKTDECLSSELQIPVQAWEMYRGYADSLKTMMSALGPMAKDVAKMSEKFKDLKGYPMASETTVKVMGYSSRTTSEVIEVKRGPIPASAWEIPAGYKKVDNPMLKALESSK